MPTIAKTLRELLAVERAAGVSFDIAWGRSVRRALRGCPGREWADWRAALEETRDAWAAAWAGEAPTAAMRALGAITDDPDREPLRARCDHRRRAHEARQAA